MLGSAGFTVKNLCDEYCGVLIIIFYIYIYMYNFCQSIAAEIDRVGIGKSTEQRAERL